jgi:hypothetical protein
MVLGWMFVMVPVVLLNNALTNAMSWFKFVPLVPVAAAIMTALAVVWLSAYVYMLYRRIVDDDAKPA